MVAAVATIIVAADAAVVATVADATDAVQVAQVTADADAVAVADADAAVKNVAGGSSGKTKIVAIDAINAVIAAAINSATSIVMPIKDRLWVCSEKYSLHALCLPNCIL